MKKILYIITQSEWGGAQKYVHDLALNLRGDFDIAVVCGGKGLLIEKLRQKGIKAAVFKNLVRRISPLKDLICFFQLYRFIKKNGFDIVHTNSSKAEILGNLAAKLAGAPKIIFTAHGFVFSEPLFSWKRKIFIFLERFANKFADKIIAVSDFDRRSAVKQGIALESKLEVVYHGLDLDKFENLDKASRKEFNIPENALLIGTAANFYPSKGLKYFINSASLLCRDFYNLYFLIIGQGGLKKNLQKQIKEQGLENKIIMPGFRPDALQIMKIMDIFVLSSVKEGLPYCLLEAMALGLPIAASKAGGVPEIIEDKKTGLLSEPADFYGLAENIKILIKDKNLRRELSENSEKKIQSFTIERMAEETKNIYK